MKHLNRCAQCRLWHRNAHTLCDRCHEARMAEFRRRFEFQKADRANDPGERNNTTDTPQHSS